MSVGFVIEPQLDGLALVAGIGPAGEHDFSIEDHLLRLKIGARHMEAGAHAAGALLLEFLERVDTIKPVPRQTKIDGTALVDFPLGVHELHFALVGYQTGGRQRGRGRLVGRIRNLRIGHNWR